MGFQILQGDPNPPARGHTWDLTIGDEVFKSMLMWSLRVFDAVKKPSVFGKWSRGEPE